MLSPRAWKKSSILKADVFVAIIYLYALTDMMATHIVVLADMFMEAFHDESGS